MGMDDLHLSKNDKNLIVLALLYSSVDSITAEFSDDQKDKMKRLASLIMNKDFDLSCLYNCVELSKKGQISPQFQDSNIQNLTSESIGEFKNVEFSHNRCD